ncbi:hypothetical protein K8354_05950 [Polaribacter litorisediminis]|uniref:hypothetical protein n=1 Tax=Polaribacter litorisediminis TaxID=1908341 RepID=UPI001CC0CB1E|nr:hypothetical protein [Polaribacter litorisediminis]UAM99354.1 hypothetical protein K8354_05950 [Polaribacter litorisediminis]
MKKSITSLLFMCILFVYAQEKTLDSRENSGDTIAYHKNKSISKPRTFKKDLKETYNGKDFVYQENNPNKKVSINNSFNLGIFEFFIFFMQTIFPFLLGAFIIFIILKVLLGFDAQFWKPSKRSKKITETLIYENENLHELHLEGLLKQALENKNFRLAIRYYYLTSLKILSNKEMISYHKDKTNSAYLSEIENRDIKNQFSYLSYVYAYVWYGEFTLDEASFIRAQHKYQSFLKSLV